MRARACVVAAGGAGTALLSVSAWPGDSPALAHTCSPDSGIKDIRLHAKASCSEGEFMKPDSKASSQLLFPLNAVRGRNLEFI